MFAHKLVALFCLFAFSDAIHCHFQNSIQGNSEGQCSPYVNDCIKFTCTLPDGSDMISKGCHDRNMLCRDLTENCLQQKGSARCYMCNNGDLCNGKGVWNSLPMIFVSVICGLMLRN